MTNCKQIPLPRVEDIDIHKLDFFFKLGNHLFETRYSHHAWKSFDLLRHGKVSPMMKHFPFIESAICAKTTLDLKNKALLHICSSTKESNTLAC